MCVPQCRCGGQKTVVRTAASLCYMCSGGQTPAFRPGSKQCHLGYPTEPSCQPVMVSFFDVIVLRSGSTDVPQPHQALVACRSLWSRSLAVIITSELSGIRWISCGKEEGMREDKFILGSWGPRYIHMYQYSRPALCC